MNIIEREKNGLSYYCVDKWSDAGVIHGFLTREFDTKEMGDITRIAKLFADEAACLPSVAMLAQVHGAELIDARDVVPLTGTGKLPRGDAWVGRANSAIDTLLGVKTADCIPLLLRAPDVGVVASIHAGWRGTVAGILSAVVNYIVEQCSATRARLELAIGPGAKSCCYEVGSEVVEAVRSYSRGFSGVSQAIKIAKNGKNYLDLQTILAAEAHFVGLESTNICLLKECSICNVRFFSARREKDLAGRQLSFIGAALPVN